MVWLATKGLQDRIRAWELLAVGLVVTCWLTFSHWPLLSGAELTFSDDFAFFCWDANGQDFWARGVGFTESVFAMGRFQPLIGFTMAAQYGLFGLNPVGHFVYALLLGVVATLLLYGLVRQLGAGVLLAGVVAAGFILGPHADMWMQAVATEAVALPVWLLGAWLGLSGALGGRRGLFHAGVGAVLLAGLYKETMVLLGPFTVAALYAVRAWAGGLSFSCAARKYWREVLAWALLWSVNAGFVLWAWLSAAVAYGEGLQSAGPWDTTLTNTLHWLQSAYWGVPAVVGLAFYAWGAARGKEHGGDSWWLLAGILLAVGGIGILLANRDFVLVERRLQPLATLLQVLCAGGVVYLFARGKRRVAGVLIFWMAGCAVLQMPHRLYGAAWRAAVSKAEWQAITLMSDASGMRNAVVIQPRTEWPSINAYRCYARGLGGPPETIAVPMGNWEGMPDGYLKSMWVAFAEEGRVVAADELAALRGTDSALASDPAEAAWLRGYVPDWQEVKTTGEAWRFSPRSLSFERLEATGGVVFLRPFGDD